MKRHVSSFMLVLVALFISGCSSTMKVAPGVMDMSKQMTQKEATQILVENLAPRAKGDKAAYWGICKLAPLKVEVDYRKGADVKVDNEGISFNVLQQERKITAGAVGAAVATTLVTGIAVVSPDYEYTPFREVRRFGDISTIRINEGGWNTICFPDKGQSEVLVRESTSLTRWYVALIPTAEKDRFIAAWLRLKPGVEITD